MTEETKIILEKIDELGKKVEKIDELDKKFNEQDKKFNKLDKKFDELSQEVTSIKLTLENTISKNIMRVAEGHLDLSRKLDEALKVENERELLVIRVNFLENEVRKLKEQIAKIS